MSNIKSTKSAKGKASVIAGDVEAVGGRELTEKQRKFVECFTSGKDTAGNKEASALAAGYSKDCAYDIGHQLLDKPHVLAAIDAELRECITLGMTVEALAVIRMIITNPDANMRLRGDMAAKVIEYSGLVERTKMEKAKQTGLDGTVPLIAMSRQALEDTVRKGAAILTAAASLPRAGAIIEGCSAPDTAHSEPIAAE